MDLEIAPEPTSEEREALEQALVQLATHANGSSPWWEAGVREAVGEEAEG